MRSSIYAPPPWSLSGKGLVMLYHFPHSFTARYGFVANYQHQGYRGWLGAVLLLDYATSNVGPYQELMFIPGLFKLGGKYCFSISRIYVSTEASLSNGLRNWGIPKELAQFSHQQQPNGCQLYQVSRDGQPMLEATATPFGPSLPFNSRVLPLIRLVQQHEQQLLLTSPEASGKFALSSVQISSKELTFFPPVQNLRPLAAFSLSEFQMVFPEAEMLE